jgi:transcriptional regulator with GAF, ATPase, and Fis domain
VHIVFGARTLPIVGRGVRIGRVAGNDLVVADPRISSRHGRIALVDGGAVYEDLGSRNGSIVERGDARIVARPNEPVPIAPGDTLLLGDLVSPVRLTVIGARVAQPSAEGTVVARRAMNDGDQGLAHADPKALRALFGLLHRLSGETDVDAALGEIIDAVLARFPHAASARVLQRDGTGVWSATQEKGEVHRPASTTLAERALAARELVAYLPDGDGGPKSAAGLAGAVIVPLLAGEHAIGVLHVDSRSRPFQADDLAWLSIVGTYVAASLVSARRFTTLRAQLRSAANMPRPIVGESASLARSLKQLARVARTASTVLILGETGTGKELAARYVHANSRRAEKPFVPVNCAALPESLLESELFGHRKGAFTGAHADRKGLFEAADGGTVFLDEIGEIEMSVQVKLLRVLQEREIQPVGARGPVSVDVRIVAATNRDLKADVEAGRFREDLYYRIAVFPVCLPPLRERAGDVRLLAERFRQAACARNGVFNTGFTPKALALLEGHPWPGNVRQLEHEIERAVILADEGEPIDVDALSDAVAGPRAAPVEPEAVGTDALPTGALKVVMAQLEEQVVRRALDAQSGNRTQAAKELGISRQALQVKLAKWRRRDEP